MATPQSKVLATAAAEIGYSRWNDPHRGTKYARETQPVFWPRDTWLLANGISFCDIFVTWVFWKALGEDFVTSGALPAGASYNTDYRASKGGRVSKPPKPGDVLVFDWNWATLSTNHVGILEKVLPSGNYQTIEGNTSPGSSGSQGNGGGVYRRTRRPGQVRYVIRPQWSKAGGSAASPAKDPSRPWRSSPRVAGMSAAEVREIQQTLTDLDYSLGSYGVDGSYGDATGTAVKALQADLGITADGVYGPGTEKALMSKLAALEKKVDRSIAIATVNQRRIDRISRTLEPGIAGKRTDGEAIHAIRKFRNDIRSDIAKIPAEVLDEPVALEGKWKGQEGSLRGVRAWYAEDMRALRALVTASEAAVLEAVQETGRAQGLTDEQVQAIATAAAEASARVSAEDVAGQLEVGVRADTEG